MFEKVRMYTKHQVLCLNYKLYVDHLALMALKIDVPVPVSIRILKVSDIYNII